MRLKPQQYWAIIITLLFHTVLFWALFFSEIRKSQKNRAYEIELSEKMPSLKEEKKLKKSELEKIAKQQLREMMSSKAAKRPEVGEEIAATDVTEEMRQLQQEFEQKKAQASALKRVQKRPKITFTENRKRPKQQVDTVKQRQTVFYVGKSRVEYFLAERYRVKLPIPVYKCEGAGVVEVAIWVNRKGIVTQAEVIKVRSYSASECMRNTALNAALTSSFSESKTALVSQKGRIVYQFAAQ